MINQMNLKRPRSAMLLLSHLSRAIFGTVPAGGSGAGFKPNGRHCGRLQAISSLILDRAERRTHRKHVGENMTEELFRPFSNLYP